MPVTSEVFKKYPNLVFIETGSYQGDGIQAALDAGFETIYSIELMQKWQSHCINRFTNQRNVKIILGQSQDILPKILKNINTTITFWLDGHYSGPHTALGDMESPLIQELEIIRSHPIKSHTIIIDDLREWNMEKHGFNTQILKDLCININPDYKFNLENGFISNDILVAHI